MQPKLGNDWEILDGVGLLLLLLGWGVAAEGGSCIEGVGLF